MGVVDSNGQQWETCNGCSKYTKLEGLGYQKPNTVYKHGRDLCVKCAAWSIEHGHCAFEDIIPGYSWVVIETQGART